MKTLRISDKILVPNRNKMSLLLAFDLIDILHECMKYSNKLWIAWAVDCIGSHWDEILTEAPNKQVQLSFYELLDYGRDVTQTLDGYFLAVSTERSSIQNIPNIKHFKDCLEISDLIIRAFDASFWEVTSSDEQLLAKLATKFKETTIYG